MISWKEGIRVERFGPFIDPEGIGTAMEGKGLDTQ